jgi:hypothetical protein
MKLEDQLKTVACASDMLQDVEGETHLPTLFQRVCTTLQFGGALKVI